MCHARHRPSSTSSAGLTAFAGSESGPVGRRQGPSCGPVWFRPYDADAADPRRRAAGALRVLGPAALAGAAIVVFVPWASWVIFAVGWMLFPAVGQVAGAAADLGRRALADPPPPSPLPAAGSAVGSSTGATVAAAETAAILERLRGAVERLPAGAARDGGANVGDAAGRLLAAAEPTAPERERLLAPAASLLADYARVAAAAPPDDATLASVAADLPRLAAKLDERAAALAEAPRRDETEHALG